MDKSERNLRDFIKSLFSNATASSLVSDVAEIAIPDPYRVRLKVVFSETSPLEVLSASALRGQISRLAGSSIGFLLEGSLGRKPSRPLSVPFAIAGFGSNSASSQVQAILSVCRHDEWRALTRFASARYPNLAPVLLSQGELLRSARKLALATIHEVRVRALSAKERIGGGGTGFKSRSVREWTNEELEAAIEDSRERQQTITSLDLEFFPRSGHAVHVVPSAICKIRRTGELEVTGSLRLAFENVAAEIARVGQEKLKLLSRRGMREASYQPRPLAISFSKPVFDTVETVREFVSVLVKYPNAMYSVQHGNPYAQATITDFGDGSSFEVWAVPPAQIVLVPGLAASPAAFERIVHYVFDTFREGIVENYGSPGFGEGDSATSESS
jgi:hypothetical protein